MNGKLPDNGVVFRSNEYIHTLTLDILPRGIGNGDIVGYSLLF